MPKAYAIYSIHDNPSKNSIEKNTTINFQSISIIFMNTSSSKWTKEADRATSTFTDHTPDNTMASNHARYLAHSYSYTSFPSIETAQEQEEDDEEEEVVKETEQVEVEPRILNLLEPLRRLYTERKQMFGSMFSGIFHELIKKVNSLVPGAGSADQMRPETVERRLSQDSSHGKKKFKVQTLEVDGDCSNDDGKQIQSCDHCVVADVLTVDSTCTAYVDHDLRSTPNSNNK